MEFTVPQFIEKEAKIVGPLTFKQFVFVGTAGAVCIFLYFTVGLRNFFLFIILSIFLLGGAAALAFLKIQRVSLPVLIKNFFFFLLRPKIYIWQKKFSPSVFSKSEKITEEKRAEVVDEKSPLSTTGQSRLKKLFTNLETKR